MLKYLRKVDYFRFIYVAFFQGDEMILFIHNRIFRSVIYDYDMPRDGECRTFVPSFGILRFLEV